MTHRDTAFVNFKANGARQYAQELQIRARQRAIRSRDRVVFCTGGGGAGSVGSTPKTHDLAVRLTLHGRDTPRLQQLDYLVWHWTARNTIPCVYAGLNALGIYRR
jgi:hypothetical protein